MTLTALDPKTAPIVLDLPGAFTNTGLEKYLRDLGVTQVVIVGIAASIGVESTARQAYECGFNVTLAVDAKTDTGSEAHSKSVAKIFPRLGETGTTRQALDPLRGAPEPSPTKSSTGIHPGTERKGEQWTG